MNQTKNKYIGLLAWLAFTFTASAAAFFVDTGGWYAEIAKPDWNPPSWVFGPAWTVLYVMMAVAAWLVWCDGGWRKQKKALTFFCVQWAFNAIWTPVFFGFHQIGLALAIIAALWIAILLTMERFWRVSVLSMALMIPYLAWVTFASMLNLTIWLMNR